MSKKPQPTAETWFKRADHFQYTSLHLLQQPPEMNFVFAYPHIVLKAFAAEAYLKALISVEAASRRRFTTYSSCSTALR